MNTEKYIKIVKKFSNMCVALSVCLFYFYYSTCLPYFWTTLVYRTCPRYRGVFCINRRIRERYCKDQIIKLARSWTVLK